MAEDGKKHGLRNGLIITGFGVVLGWILNTFGVPVWSWIKDAIGTIPAIAYWGASLVAAFVLGRRAERSRTRKGAEAESEAEHETEAGGQSESGAEPESGTESESGTASETESEPEWIRSAGAEALVRESNYWSRIKRRRALNQLEAEFEYEQYGIEPEPEPLEIESAAIMPPRHTPDVDAVLQHFWDDHPSARSGGSYHRAMLMDWLEEQAHDVDLPNT